MLHLEHHKKWIKAFKYHEDLYQESIISLLKQGNEKVIRLYNDGEIDRYFSKIVRVTNYQVRSKHNTNFKDDRRLIYKGEIQERVYSITPDIDIQEECAKVTDYWLDQELLKMYAMEGSISKVAELTTIPHKTIKRRISNLKKKMI